jgi:hypothetical protein
MIANFIKQSAGFVFATFFSLVMVTPVLLAANPETRYTLVQREAAFEIRDYPAMFTAEISMPGQRDDVLTAASNVLSAYVQGDNLSKKKIATVKPVFHQLAPPLTSAIRSTTKKKSEFNQNWSVSFSLLGNGPLEDFPRPGDRRIDLIEMPPCRMAVLQFSGLWTDSNLDEHRDALARLLKEKGLKPVGNPIFAFYDEFWQPFFWRHNEVMWEISLD